MKAMVLYRQSSIESKPLVYKDVEKPVPDREQVLLEIKACGVCRTDLHIVEGELPLIKLPLIPGHQVVGVVVDRGDDARDIPLGTRVGVPWLYWSCGECRYCRRGLENLCDRALFTGYSVNGGYAEYMVVHKDFIHKIPENYSNLDAAPLLCGGAIGYRALRLTKLLDYGEGVLGLFGFGSSAHLILQVAVYKGLEVYVFTSKEEKIEKALEMGASWAGYTRDSPPKKLDAAIVFAPVSWVAVEALKKLDKGGRLVFAEIHMTPFEKLDYKLLWFERELKSVANVTREDVREFLVEASRAGVKPDTQVYSLEEANRALEDLKYGRVRASAVLKIK